MIKKLVIGLTCLWAASANALDNETLHSFCDSDEKTWNYVCEGYASGVLDTNRLMRLVDNPECTKFKPLSATMLVAAYKTHYKELDPKDPAIFWLTKYSYNNIPCEK